MSDDIVTTVGRVIRAFMEEYDFDIDWSDATNIDALAARCLVAAVQAVPTGRSLSRAETNLRKAMGDDDHTAQVGVDDLLVLLIGYHKAEERLAKVQEMVPLEVQYGGWVVANGKEGAELRYRDIDQGVPIWTTDREQALRFTRRADAEKFAAEDEDAWRILPIGGVKTERPYANDPGGPAGTVKGGTKRFHMKMNIAGFIEQTSFPKGYENMLLDDDGNTMTPRQALNFLNEELAKGHKYVSCSADCIGFDPVEKGCPGHPVPDAQ